jgi:putative nucleotidyltransferase with HDIG domain
VDYKTFVKAVRNLPTPSPVLLRIENVLQNPEASPSEIAEVIRLDPAITSKVIRLANSAYVGVSRTVSTLQNAVILLGSERVHSLVLASELLNSVKIKFPLLFTLDKFWLHSVTTALIAEAIANHLRRSEVVDENEVFIAALLHDIGKLVIAQLLPDALREAHTKSKQNCLPYWKSEDPELCHTNAGKYLAEHWSFPAILTSAIHKHHEPESAGVHSMIVSIIHIADVTAHMIGRSTIDDEVSPEVSNFALEKVALSQEGFRVIAVRAIEDKKKVDSLLEMFSPTSANC